MLFQVHDTNISLRAGLLFPMCLLVPGLPGPKGAGHTNNWCILIIIKGSHIEKKLLPVKPNLSFKSTRRDTNCHVRMHKMVRGGNFVIGSEEVVLYNRENKAVDQ